MGNNESTEADNWSAIYTFQTLPSGSGWPLKFIMLGDLGVQNGLSIPHLEEEAQSGSIHMILHNGDFAYDFDTVSYHSRQVDLSSQSLKGWH